MLKKSITLYYDVISPYTWIAFESLLRYEKILGANLKLVPAGLGFIMRETGNPPPAQVQKKGEYIERDWWLIGDYWGVPLRPPRDFNDLILKKGSLGAMRLLTALDMRQKELVVPVAREFWMRLWSREQTIHEPEDIVQVCKDLKIPNHDEIIQFAKDQQVKDRLKSTTDEAIKAGAFGMPWIVVKREGMEDVSIFGSDRLPLICHLLNSPFNGPMKESESKL
ncbi:DSBA-like thioredoxin domain-containing protein [Ditylenchus destructor]|uniref:Glutathione S-transferase kappa n=1 Tax=Ditylenchus destructor TaxID=166010 RepID=A0AAD4N8Q6_9BILA|nr:DSBA-like thioredoxin domain-containing protein [Ditylenchus destructor]